MICVASAPALAVVVATEDPSLNEIAPENDPGWVNVGERANATAVYLGNRWVLTAAHVGVGSVSFPVLDATFEADTSTRVQIQNPPGSGRRPTADIVLFQLKDDPQLAPLEIARQPPPVGTEIMVIGNGLNYDLKQLHWDVEQRGVIWTWSRTSPPGEFSGYRTNTVPAVMRWGTNLVEDEESFFREFDEDIHTNLRLGTFETATFLTEFDLNDSTQSDDDVRTLDGLSATEFESQAVLNDSGGPSFYLVDGRWQLAGLVLSVDDHRSQPDVTRNAIFGNLTYYGDLSTYRDQIQEHFLYGDFDGDQQITTADIDALTRAMNQPEYAPHFDLNRDGDLSLLDHSLWIEEIGYTFNGDANFDGQFDTTDIVTAMIAGEYDDNLPGNSTWATGDWNADLEFDSEDWVTALKTGGYLKGPRPPRDQEVVAVNAQAAFVPEPSSLLLLMITGLSLLIAVRR